MPGIKLPKNVFKGDVAVDQFHCVSCKLLLRDPVQAACGHRLCKSCADEIIKNETTPQCPECGEGFDEEDGVQVRNREELEINACVRVLVAVCFVFHLWFVWGLNV